MWLTLTKAIAVAAILGSSTVVYADEAPPLPSASTSRLPVAAPPTDPVATMTAPAARNTGWYGGEVLLVDTTSFLLFAVPGIGPLGIVGYFGAPFVHSAHGRSGTMGASFGLRLGIPALTGVIAFAAGCGNCLSASSEKDIAYGVFLGMLTAAILDASLLSYEAIPTVAPDPKLTTKPAAIAWYPTGGPHKEGGFTLGLGGTF